MRVTNRLLYDQFVKDIGLSSEKLFKTSGQISSGKRIGKPSDDPLGLSRVLGYRTELSAFEQYQKSIDLADGWLSQTNSVINEVDDLLARASELAVQMASSTSTQSGRLGAAEEIRQIREMVLGLANSKYGNKYLFGGTMTQEAPFLSASVTGWQDDVDTMAADDAEAVANLGGAAAAGDRYINTTDGTIREYDGAAWQVSAAASEGISAVSQSTGELYVYRNGQWSPQYVGNDDIFSVKIGKTDTAEINIPGNDLFRNSSGDVFMTLMELERALRNNDITGISGSLDALENSSENLNNKLAKVGAVVNRLDQTKSVLTGAVVTNKQITSDIEDLDYAEAITSLQSQQTVYQAILKSVSMITSMSLVDYI